MRKKVFIIITIFIIVSVLGTAYYITTKGKSYQLSTELNKAIDERNYLRIESILGESSVDVNNPGHNPSDYGSVRPITEACYTSDYDIAKLLIDYGARVYDSDYYELLCDINLEDYDIVSMFIEHGFLPKVEVSENENLLVAIAYTDVTDGENVFGIDDREWFDYILNLYVLVYKNASEFDKKQQLEKSLEAARITGNKLLVEYIEGELSSLIVSR